MEGLLPMVVLTLTATVLVLRSSANSIWLRNAMVDWTADVISQVGRHHIHANTIRWVRCGRRETTGRMDSGSLNHSRYMERWVQGLNYKSSR